MRIWNQSLIVNNQGAECAFRGQVVPGRDDVIRLPICLVPRAAAVVVLILPGLTIAASPAATPDLIPPQAASAGVQPAHSCRR